MTSSEAIASVLAKLVAQIADDMLTDINSGVEDIYYVYVRDLDIEEGSY